jgi:GT2 family glycosyltransferase
MVSIIIPLFNNLDLTKSCIESIEEFTPEEYEIIFVDNGSKDGTGDYLKFNMKPNWKLIENNENKGFPVACNQGMCLSEGEYILILNNDTVVSPEWLKGMLECINSADDIGIVGPRTNNVSGAQAVKDGFYNDYDSYVKYAINFRKAMKGLYLPRWRIVGFCYLFKRQLIDEIGYFDERFTPGNFEDDDYCLRAMEAGYRNMICSDVFIHHHGSMSHDKSTFAQILEANQKKFVDKWDTLTLKSMSAVMIVKNEEEHLQRCLEALAPQVEEIIIVDTGSSDKTKEIASKFDKVKLYEREWIDDFSDARNFANSKATMNWIFSIDADEVVTGLKEAKEKLVHPYMAIRVNTRNYTDNVRTTGWQPCVGEYKEEFASGWFPSEKVRIWRNHPKVCFEYPVHEVVENSIYYLGWKIVTDYSIQVHHYGRLKDNYEYGHGSKYYDLLKKQLESGKNDLRSLEQLATQAQGLKHFDDAIKYWEEVLKIEPDNGTAHLNMGHSYASMGNWVMAQKYSKNAWRLKPSKESAMNVAVGEYMLRGDWKLATKICEDLIEKYPNYPLPQGLLGAIKKLKEEINVSV